MQLHAAPSVRPSSHSLHAGALPDALANHLPLAYILPHRRGRDSSCLSRRGLLVFIVALLSFLSPSSTWNVGIFEKLYGVYYYLL